MRGLIDEYEYHRSRDHFLHQWWRDTRAIVAILAGSVLFSAQVVTLIILWGH